MVFESIYLVVEFYKFLSLFSLPKTLIKPVENNSCVLLAPATKEST